MTELEQTGQDRLAKNVAASYAGYLVFIVLGFVMPRVIDNEVGQDGLGIWDLGWSLVSYLSLTMVGIGSSVNRFVAKHRAAGDVAALNSLMSTVIAIQLLIATAVLICSLVLFLAVPIFFAEQLGELAATAGWVTGLLGASLAVQMAFDAWRGVLSGCHRWDYYNAINAGGYTVNALLMIAVLMMGGGLKGIALSYLSITIVTELLRFVVARRVCPELIISRKSINRRDGMVAIRFGVKTIVLAVPGIVVIQTVNLFIVAALGPAMLAVLARPISLISHISTLMNKYAFVLTPVAGSLQGRQSKKELVEFSLVHARAGWIFAIPFLIFLFVFGDAVLEIWMGKNYASWTTIAVLSAGYLFPVSQSPILRILIGMDMHGRVAKTSLVIAGAILLAGITAGQTLGWSVELGAGVIALAVGLGTGVNVLGHGFSALDWSIRDYLRCVVVDAAKLFFILLVPLVALRLLMKDMSVSSLLIAGLILTALIFALAQRRDIRQVFRIILLGRRD